MDADDIRPPDLMRGQRESMEADIAFLISRRDEFVEVACPACDGDDYSPLYEKYELAHRVCGLCGTQFISPRPDAALLEQFYARSQNYAYWAEHIFPASADVRREQIFKPRAELVRDLAAEYGLKGTMIEVGAGFGLFCEEVANFGIFDRIVGVEPTPNLAQVCRDLGFECYESSFEKVKIDGKADLIAAFEVIEHLFSPQDYLQWCHALLNPGGIALLTCPNIHGFETLVLGKRSDTVDHEHLNLFNTESISLLGERLGFRVLQAETPGELDFSIVRSAFRNGDVSAKEVGPFLAQLLSDGHQAAGTAFQSFLRNNRLSSNMRIVLSRQ